MIHISIIEGVQDELEKDEHGVSSRWHLLRNSTDGSPDRSGSGINGVVAQAARHSKMPRSKTAPPKGSKD